MVLKSSDFCFLSFVSKIVYPNYDSNSFVLYMFVVYNRVINFQQPFKIRIVGRKYFETLLPLELIVRDLNNTIIVNGHRLHGYIKNVLMTVSEKNIGDSNNKNAVRRKVHIVASPCPDDLTVLMLPSLFHNLSLPHGDGLECFLKMLRTEHAFKVAPEVEVSLINNAYTDWGNAVLDQMLNNYFKTPKILYPGDLIEVNVRDHGPEIFYGRSKSFNIHDCLYFKCNQIARGNLCVSNGTTLKQAANIQSFIPIDIGHDLCPYGLKAEFEEVKKAIRPFIKKSLGCLKFKPIFLIEGSKGSGKSLIIKSLVADFGAHLNVVYNFEVSANVYAQNETKVKNVLFQAKMSAPCILELRNFENFGKNSDGLHDERLIEHFAQELDVLFTNNDFPLIVICSSNEKNIPISVRRLFLKCFAIKAPGEQQREDNLIWLLNLYKMEIPPSKLLKTLACKTSGFLLEDLRALVKRSVTNSLQSEGGIRGVVGEEDFSNALDYMQANYNQSLGAPKVPKVRWADIGGLSEVKDEIVKLIKLPLQHPQLFKATGLRRSGVLLYGPPGTGKTLIAKAVATEYNLCFLSVKGPELLNMYVGQSEQNVREVFERAREASPCIVFFDELDSLAPNRGASGDSGGVMDRVVSQLLAEMDGLNQSGTIFIIGATNRPDLIDPALLRPGRFDKLLYVGPCADREAKKSVLKALTRKFGNGSSFDLDQVVDLCPDNFSGADFYGVCSGAWMSAVRRIITETSGKGDKNYSARSEDVQVTLEDFRAAIKSVKPSITQKDLAYFDALKTNY